MVSKFQFLLDNQYVDDPKGWEDVDTTIKRDQTISGLLISQEAQLEFYGNGYTYIKSQFDTQGFCSFVEIEIRQTCDQINYEKIFNGIIYLSDCEFDLMRCSVKVKTVDDSFYARINNNKSLKAKIDVGRSKNDTTIAAAAAIAVQFFDPSTGNYVSTAGQQPNVYTAYEVLKFLVAFMTDDRVGFVSNDFAPGGQWQGQTIVSGGEIRLRDQSVIPEISFEEVFTELNKKNRIGFSIEKISGKPTLRVENLDYFYTQTSAVTLSDAKEVKMKMDTAQLYSQVRVGSTTFDESIPLVGQFPEAIRFLGFRDETFNIIGTCNIDRTLELASEWIISSNLIEDVFINGNNSYENNIFLIDVDLATNKAVQSNWVGVGTSVFYNETFNNKTVIERWLKGIPNSVAFYLKPKDNTFTAGRTFLTSFNLYPGNPNYTELPFRFDNDYAPGFFDTNNNYGNGTIQGNSISAANSRYTAPQGGIYNFYSIDYINFTDLYSGLGAGNQVIAINFDFYHYDSGNNIINSYLYVKTLKHGQIGTYALELNKVINMSAGDYLVCRLVMQVSGGIYSGAKGTIQFGLFKCLASADGGGIYQSINPADYKIKKFSFKYPITFQQLKTIKLDTKKLITFTTNNNIQETGWIDNIKYYHHNKEADVTLITN